MKLLILLLLFPCILKAQSFTIRIEKFEDPYENSYYPTIEFNKYLNVKKYVFDFNYWSNVDKEIYPYITLSATRSYKRNDFTIYFNPLKADIYNSKILFECIFNF